MPYIKLKTFCYGTKYYMDYCSCCSFRIGLVEPQKKHEKTQGAQSQRFLQRLSIKTET